MLRKFLLSILMLCMLPVFAGELENALSANKNVLLYLYTPECSACSVFTPAYEKLSKTYGNQYKFIKVDASTNYGSSLLRKYGSYYVPFIVLIGSNKKTAKVSYSCLMYSECADKALTKFLNNGAK